MMRYEYCSSKNEIYLKASGVLTADDCIDYFQHLDESGVVDSPALEYVHFTNLESADVSFEGVERVRAAFIAHNHGQKLAKSIFIADSDLSYGIARMIGSALADVFPSFEITKISVAGA